MPLLHLQSASLAFGHLPLFEEADLRVEAGERIGLIGRNGTGKSSLLKVLAGEIPLDAGTVWREPGLRVARLDQFAFVGEAAASPEGGAGDTALGRDRGTVREEIARGLGPLVDLESEEGWRHEQKVKLVISRLGLPADRLVSELSGGWRRRTLLAKALVAAPDLLLLDEPTNHLDIEAITWLEGFVAGFAGAIVFVTHDRAFLSKLATRIVELDRGRLTSWPGSYPTFLEKKAAALDAEARELERLDKKLAQEEAWLRQGVKARRTRNEGRVRELIKLRAERASRRDHVGAVRLAVDSSNASGKLVFDARGVVKRFDGVTVIDGYTQRIFRGDRVGLIGPNGSGKSTLLKLLVGELAPDAGEIRRGTRLQVAYYAQQSAFARSEPVARSGETSPEPLHGGGGREQLDLDATVMDTVNDGNTTVVVNGEPKHVLGYLADFLFPRERALSPVRSLSGGERNRLLLARLFARPANVLVLDEPTNDLDMETLELLEELVSDFTGTVLLVSHDRVFLDRVVTSTLAFEGDGRVIEYVGGYEDYLRQRPAGGKSESGARQDAGTEGSAAAREGTAALEARAKARPRRLTYKEQRELDALPERIASLEDEQARLKDEAAAPEFYKTGGDHIRAVLARIDAVHAELDAALARWVELESIGKGL